MLECAILRTNRTLKRIRVKEKDDSFTFEEGTYYIRPEHVILEKRLIGFRPKLYFVENVSEPISFENITVKPIKVKDKDGKETDVNETTILIDAKSIHNLTSRELLSVLTKASLTKIELLMLIATALIFLTNVVILGIVAQ